LYLTFPHLRFSKERVELVGRTGGFGSSEFRVKSMVVHIQKRNSGHCTRVVSRYVGRRSAKRDQINASRVHKSINKYVESVELLAFNGYADRKHSWSQETAVASNLPPPESGAEDVRLMSDGPRFNQSMRISREYYWKQLLVGVRPSLGH
jgi:hypothetical protein